MLDEHYFPTSFHYQSQVIKSAQYPHFFAFFFCLWSQLKQLVSLNKDFIQNKPTVLVAHQIKFQNFEELGQMCRLRTCQVIADIYLQEFFLFWIQESAPYSVEVFLNHPLFIYEFGIFREGGMKPEWRTLLLSHFCTKF